MSLKQYLLALLPPLLSTGTAQEEVVQIQMMDYRYLLAEQDREDLPENDPSPQNTARSNEPIFGQNFDVEDMTRPQLFLPQYNTYQKHQETCFESFNLHCGQFCIFLAYPFALCCCKCYCIYELPTSAAGIVEQFGKFNRIINPGFNMINPCAEEVKQIDMKLQILNSGGNQCITKDNVKLTVNSSVTYRITNPVLVYYVLGKQLDHALTESTQASIRNVIGQNILDQILTHRDRITNQFRRLVLKNIPKGITIENVFIQDIIVPHETLRALTATARQKRLSEATIINSKADVESAQMLKEAAQLLDTKAAMQIRYLEMVNQVGKKGATLLMPIGVNNTGQKY